MKATLTCLLIAVSIAIHAQTLAVSSNKPTHPAIDCRYGINPLYILNNKIILCDSVALIKTEDIEEIRLYKAVEAVALYGSNARNGAVAITTKQYAALRKREKEAAEIEKP